MTIVSFSTQTSATQRSLTNVVREVDRTSRRLSTGLRVRSAADDASGLVISEHQRAQISGLTAGIENIDRARNLLQTAEAALGVINQHLVELRTLAVDAANVGAHDSVALQQIQEHANHLLASIDHIAGSTRVGGIHLLNGSAGLTGTIGERPSEVPTEALNDIVSTNEVEPLTIRVLDNDTSADGALSLISVTQGSNGSVTLNDDNTLSYTPGQGFIGDDSFEYTIQDQAGTQSTGTVSVTVAADNRPYLETGIVSGITNQSYTTVTLDRSYKSPVVLLSVNYGAGDPPVVPRLRNVAGNSFEVSVSRFDGDPPGNPQNRNTDPTSGINIHYTVVEEGVYTQAEHGVTMEARVYTSTLTDHAGSFVGEQQPYQQSYSSPVVLGQVQTSNDPEPSVFFARGGSNPNSSTSPPDASILRTGKQVLEDQNQDRADELIGYVVIETGDGSIENRGYTAAIGPDTIRGFGDGPPNSYDLTGLTNPGTANISAAAIDGNNGGYPILYGSNPLSATELDLAIDEDTLQDAERNHTTEQVSYLVLEANADPNARSDSRTTTEDVAVTIDVLANDDDYDGDTLSIQSVTQGSNGSVGINGNGSLSYSPNAGFVGSDSFSYVVSDGNGGESTGQVSISVQDRTPLAAFHSAVNVNAASGTPLNIDVTTQGERAVVVNGTTAPTGNADGKNVGVLQTASLAQDETLSINGTSISLAAGSSQADVITRINEYTDVTQVVADTDGSRTRLRSVNFGSAARVSVRSNIAAASSSTGFGTAETVDTGADIEGTIGGTAATGRGKYLTGTGTAIGVTVAAQESDDGVSTETGDAGAVTIESRALDFQLGGFASENGALAINNAFTGTLGFGAAGADGDTNQFDNLAQIKLGSFAQASDAIVMIDAAIKEIANQRASIGAFVAHTLGAGQENLRHQVQAMTEAESHIRDADMAVEIADYVRLQVQQEVAIAVESIAQQDANRLLVLMDLGPGSVF